MGDFASVIGSGPIVGLDDIPSDLSGYYRIVSANVQLDLSEHSGNNIVDASDNPYGIDVFLGSGAETVFGSLDDDQVTGGAGQDHIFGDGGDDYLLGGAGMDTLEAGAGDDLARGDAGDDVLLGGLGDDTLAGDTGMDSLAGGLGDDVLFGGRGDDLLGGGVGSDELVGGAGYDTLVGGAGDDLMSGGIGQDAFLFASGFGDDVIADFEGGKDSIWLTANLNGSGITDAGDLASHVSGSETHTLIKIGDDSILLEGVGKDDFLAHLTSWVKVVPG